MWLLEICQGHFFFARREHSFCIQDVVESAGYGMMIIEKESMEKIKYNNKFVSAQAESFDCA